MLNFRKKTDELRISLLFFSISPFVDGFSRTSSIHPGIFLGQALWADTASPPVNSIASCY